MVLVCFAVDCWGNWVVLVPKTEANVTHFLALIQIDFSDYVVIRNKITYLSLMLKVIRLNICGRCNIAHPVSFCLLASRLLFAYLDYVIDVNCNMTMSLSSTVSVIVTLTDTENNGIFCCIITIIVLNMSALYAPSL